MNVYKEVRFAIRRLAGTPGFTVLAVLTLALGIGLNSTVFSVVNAVVFKPLPVSDPDTLSFVYTTDEKGSTHGPTAFPDFLELREARAFRDLAAYTFATMALETEGKIDLTMGELGSGNLFRTLGIHAVVGRTFTADDDRPGDPQAVVVLSYASWQGRFGGDEGVVGSTVHINNHPFTVVGVAPQDFFGLTRGLEPELWVPMRMAARINIASNFTAGEATPGVDRLEDRSLRWHGVIGRRSAEFSDEQLAAEVTALGERLQKVFPETHAKRRLIAMPARDVHVLPGLDRNLDRAAMVASAFVALVLLIACTNLANMLLARALGRRQEIATRLALGAGRGQLVGQLLAESLVLTFCGGLLGLAMAWVATKALGLLLAAVPKVALDVTLDLRVVVFTAFISLLTAAAFGLVPAYQATRADLATVLRASARGPGSASRGWLRHGLVVVEVAFSLLLLVCAGLAVQSARNAGQVHPGFEVDGAVVARFSPASQGYRPAATDAFFDRLSERLRAVESIRAVGTTSHLPLTFDSISEVAERHDRASRPVEDWLPLKVADVGPGYFEAMGIPVLRGRGFDDSDQKETLPVVVVNEALAERFWGAGEDVIGRRLVLGDAERAFEVVGVTRDGKYGTLGESRRPFLYRPLAQHFRGNRMVVVRTDGDPALAMTAIREAAGELDPNLAVAGLATLKEGISVALVLPGMVALLFGLFGGAGLLLASLGLYGVIAYLAGQRTREIGIRMALGAKRRDIVAMVLKDGLVLTAVGVALGLVGTFAATRLLRAVLYGVSPTDPVTAAAVSLLLLVVALAASVLPARRASRVEPTLALRSE